MRGQGTVFYLRDRGPREDLLWLGTQGTALLPQLIKLGLEMYYFHLMWGCVADCPRDKRRFSYVTCASPCHPTDPKGLSLLEQHWEEGNLGHLQVTLAWIRGSIAEGKKVTFVQNSFGPDFHFAKVTGTGLTSAEAAAQRTSPFVRCPSHFSRTVSKVVFNLHCRRVLGLG